MFIKENWSITRLILFSRLL